MSLGKVIFHIDVNSAFLSWEAVYRLHHLGWKGDLREQVSAVGGDASWNYFGKIHSSKEISDTDR